MTWGQYFLGICKAVSLKSPCLSRQIGAIIVRNNSIVATGYNGPSRGIPHCGIERIVHDPILQSLVTASKIPPKDFTQLCPRKVLGYPSGSHMDLCPAQHAEENTVSNAARLGVSVYNTTIYLNTVIPCSKCFGTLINAGITEVVVEESKVYDEYTQYLINNSLIKIREFSKE
jgi:dCMP deaminase